MPIYEYQCNRCQCTFERLELSADDSKPQCPSCCTEDVDRLISAGSFRPRGIPTGSGGFSAPACKPSGG